MTLEDFGKLGASKEMNVTYNVILEDGTQKNVIFLDSKREEQKEGSKNCKTLYLISIDDVKCEEWLNISQVKNKVAGKNVGTRKSNGTRTIRQSDKPLTEEELSREVKKHIDALQNAYTAFYNLLVTWNIDVNSVNFANFNSEEYGTQISDVCEYDNEQKKERQSETAKEDVKRTLQKTGLSKEDLLKMLSAMQD